ncbi:MAG: CPBP family intramembrane glutamic endopeptidase [Verrucomicrobiia bacterium]
MLNKLKNRTNLFVAGLIIEFLVFIAAVGLSFLFKYKLFHNFEISPLAFFKGIAFAIPPFILLLIILRSDLNPFKRIKEILYNFVDSYLGFCSVYQLALLSLVAGIGEEALFRGFLQGILGNQFGGAIGIVVTNLAFGSLHLITQTYGIIAFLIGCYLSGVIHYTDNLFIAMWCHAIYDFAALCYIRFYKK